MRSCFAAACLLLTLLPSSVCLGQIQIGTVVGTVSDTTGALFPGAAVVLRNPVTGFVNETQADSRGAFVFNNVPFDAYSIRVSASGFQPATRAVNVRSNIPIHIVISLDVAGLNEVVEVEAAGTLVETDSSSTETDIDASLIRRATGAASNLRLQSLIATTPGWTTQNNGLLHIRGVDDGILYVVDGIPTADRIDATSGNSFDPAMIRSMDVITGNIPAEFGGRSGAVITIQPMSGIDLPVHGEMDFSGGSFRAGEIAAALGGNVGKKLGLFGVASSSRSDRYLDPTDLRNFNNRGGTLKLNIRADWHPTTSDILIGNVSANGTDLNVPNNLAQELAGQRQRQELRDNSQSLSWQHSWSATGVGNFAYFRRLSQSKLLGSEFDTPVYASQDRSHVRQGMLISFTQKYGKHTLKGGVEATRISPREFFAFAVTDEEAAEEEGISEAARHFDRTNPFVFRDRKVRGQVSWYVQDSFAPIENLTVNAGLRYDHSSLLISDQQLSPRIGGVFFVPQSKTALRASYNRMYMPPQVDNLLLAASEQARRLSPFENETGGGGAPILPEKVSAYEVGFAQDVLGWFKLDSAYWWKYFRNFDDPNVFLSTTVIFPNSVESGFARGLDLRIDVPPRKGWSGYLSYTNSRVLQTGPINGGLFLTEEAIEIGPGIEFIPDHDQRNVGSFAVNYDHRSGFWATLKGRHESGIVLEVEDDRVEELKRIPGADLVDFERGRVKPWTTFDCSIGMGFSEDERVGIRIEFGIENIFNRRFAYNFGNPFEGTHFGHPRLWSGGLKVTFR